MKRPDDIPQEIWDKTFAGQGQKLHKALKTLMRDLFKAYLEGLRKLGAWIIK